MGTDKRRDWISLFHSFNLIRDNPFHPWLKFFGFSRTEEFFDHGFYGLVTLIMPSFSRVPMRGCLGCVKSGDCSNQAVGKCFVESV